MKSDRIIMKAKIKTQLYKLLGQKRFIQLLYIGYKVSYNMGLLKNDPIYKYHYYSKKLIQKDDSVLDIGANVGYYTYLFQKWVGSQGHVYSVEPVPQFMDNLKKYHSQNENVTLWNFALGTEEKNVELIVPGEQQYLRTGLAKIKESDNDITSQFTFQAKMKKASVLFSQLKKIDFIKIDIEGYEIVVLPEMIDIIAKHLPIIQAETYGEPRQQIDDMLAKLGYTPYELEDGILKLSAEKREDTTGDVIYLTKRHSAQIS